MSEDELKAEAVRLIDTFGPWTASGSAWWVAAGFPEKPPMDLVNAVKMEQLRRRDAANPPASGSGGIISISYAPGQFDGRS